MRVLIVDDDQSELGFIEQMVKRSSVDWDVSYLKSAIDALAAVEFETIDVVVADMSMPGMDGAELLRQLRAEHPDVVRIIMSNKAEMPRVMRLVSIAHQFVTKPVDSHELVSVVARGSELHSRLSGAHLRKTIGEIGSLPSPSTVVMELNGILARSDAQIKDVVNVVTDDVAISAKILQMVNSAYFGLSQPMSDIRDAVAYLGLEAVRSLTLATEVFRTLNEERNVLPGAVDEIQNHSSAVAGLARELVLKGDNAHEAYIAGLLHDVGHLAIATRIPERYREIREKRAVDSRSICEIEKEILGATHADIGAYLMQLWGLPFNIIETVARHHDAPELVETGMNSLHATYIAEHLLAQQHGESDGFWEFTPEEAELDENYIKELGMTDRVAGWKAFQEGVY